MTESIYQAAIRKLLLLLRDYPADKETRDTIIPHLEAVETEHGEALDLLRKAEADYRGVAVTLATYGFRASSIEAIETADYLKDFLERTTA
jgi:hypothetical protein